MDLDELRSCDASLALKHVAIIMDGNGRWAGLRMLPRIAGHRQGAKVVKEIVKVCCEIGINYLTLYTFSSENWERPQDEVYNLMRLLCDQLIDESSLLHEWGIHLNFIGDKTFLQPELVSLMEQVEENTAQYDGLNLVLAVSYGAKQEITHAAQMLAEEVRNNNLSSQDITMESLENKLYTSDMPPLDLIIRTGGEKRLSNFLLWQAAYSELLFLDTLWPNFTRTDFISAVEEYNRRVRRFGRVL